MVSMCQRQTNGLAPIIGESPAMRRALGLIDRYAASNLSLLLVGPTGTGKDLFARHIHARSARRGRFVPVNCAALPREMMESLLFGHRRGSFSGAVESRRGLIALAHAGTLFLDELLSLLLEGQGKLLRALDSGEIQPLGEEGPRHVEVRVIAAVDPSVSLRLMDGSFREDLYQRVAGAVIQLPRLVDRPGDVMLLAAYFAGLQGRVLGPGAARVLARYSWPGNVRELRLAVDRAAALVSDGVLPAAALAEAVELGAPPRCDTDLRTTRTPPRAARELQRLRDVGAAHAWHVREMARALGIGRSGLYARLKRHGLTLGELREWPQSVQSRLSSGSPLEGVDSAALADP